MIVSVEDYGLLKVIEDKADLEMIRRSRKRTRMTFSGMISRRAQAVMDYTILPDLLVEQE